MDRMEYELELLSFDEKIELADLEVRKAQERASELRYQKSRFMKDVHEAILRERQKNVQADLQSDPNGSGVGETVPMQGDS